MPIYEYRCDACAAEFEVLTSATSSTRVPCPQCNGARVTRLLSAFAVGGSDAAGAAEPGPCGACGAPERGMCGSD